jgi:hypothetical protein
MLDLKKMLNENEMTGRLTLMTKQDLIPPKLFQSVASVLQVGARALHVINLIWFGYISRLSQWGGGGKFARSNDFYLPSLP